VMRLAVSAWAVYNARLPTPHGLEAL
jgi:hypothetical protein